MNTANINDSILSLHEVGVYYSKRVRLLKQEKFWPLKNISLSVCKGESVGVIGRNGAGKSTLMRLLAGIILPDHGTIVRNCDRITLLALSAGFAPHLTGRENAIINGILLGLSYREIQDRLDDIIEFSELSEFFDRPFKTYSSGMRSRLGFSTAIQIKPDVLLIDETFAVGDEEFRKKSGAKMREIIKSNRTIIFVSHIMPLVSSLASRVVWVENGVIVADGDPDHVISQYLKSTK